MFLVSWSKCRKEQDGLAFLLWILTDGINWKQLTINGKSGNLQVQKVFISKAAEVLILSTELTTQKKMDLSLILEEMNVSGELIAFTHGCTNTVEKQHKDKIRSSVKVSRSGMNQLEQKTAFFINHLSNTLTQSALAI